MLEFIANNSVWFIIGFVLIVLVIIGYYVDKRGFGIKTTYIELEKDLEKPKEETKKKSKKEIIDMDIPFVSHKKTKFDDEQNEEKEVKEEKEEKEDMFINLDETPAQPIEDNTNVEKEETVEDLSVPFGDVNEQPNEVKEETVDIPEENVQVVEENVEQEKPEEKSEETDVWNF